MKGWVPIAGAIFLIVAAIVVANSRDGSAKISTPPVASVAPEIPPYEELVREAKVYELPIPPKDDAPEEEFHAYEKALLHASRHGDPAAAKERMDELRRWKEENRDL